MTTKDTGTPLEKLREYQPGLAIVSVLLFVLSNLFSNMSWTNEMEFYYFFVDFFTSCIHYIAVITCILWGYAFLSKLLFHYRDREEDSKQQSDPENDVSPTPENNTPNVKADSFRALVNVLNILFLGALGWAIVSFIKTTVNQFPPEIYIDYFFGEFYMFSFRMLISPLVVWLASGSLLFLLRKEKNSLIIILQTIFLLMFTLCVTALLCMLAGVDISAVTIWIIIVIVAMFTLHILFGLIRQYIKTSTIAPSEIIPLIGFPSIHAHVDMERHETDRKNAPIKRNHKLSRKSLWTLRFTTGILPYIVLFGGLVYLIASCMFTIQPYQQALVYRFGKLCEQSVTEPGLHFKLPAPFETVEIVDTDRVQSLYIGYEPTESHNYLWNSTHGGSEYTLLLGNGNELVAVNLRLNYTIDDLIAYQTNYEAPEVLLSAKAYAVMMTRTMDSDLDTVLSVDRQTLSSDIAEELNGYSQDMGLGIYVEDAIIESIHPAVEVVSVYQNVVNATIQQSTLQSAAEAYAEQTNNDAQQQSTVSVNTANMEQITAVTEAQSDAKTFTAACEAYQDSPDCYLFLKTNDVFMQLIQNARLYVFSPEMQTEMQRFILENGQSAVIVGSDDE